MNAPLRHRCRNPRCKLKLPVPVENEPAFCTPGCHASFCRSRCLVCEEPMRRKRERQRLKSGHRRCEAEYRKFPRVYDYPRDEPPQEGGIGPFADESLAEAHFTRGFSRLEGERPRHRALRLWSWHSDELEHELRDADGTLLARIESNGGRHRLTQPRTAPILSWSDLDQAKRRAESLALSNLPLDSRRAADIKRNSLAPNPMGPPLNRQLSQETVIASDWRPTGNAADVPESTGDFKIKTNRGGADYLDPVDIPDFLRRAKL
jgi:hypothetical protein